jgi:hypothetical protein
MTISDDRMLVMFRNNVLGFLSDICDSGFDDLPELAGRLAGMRAEIDQLEERALFIAREGAVHDEHARDAVPPVEVGDWGQKR